MKSDRTLDRALSSLAHPICIVAILLLLINDHILKWHYGSWLTGKLSDVAWLVFAPLMVIALLALISPFNSHRTAILAFVAVGMLFSGAKTIPAVNESVRAIQAMLIGASDVDMRRDSADLIALPALLVGWYIWQQSEQKLLVRRGLIALMIAIPGTLATSPGFVDMGISCVFTENDKIYAASMDYYHRTITDIYVSEDSGLTWRNQSVNDFLSNSPSICPKFSGNNFYGSNQFVRVNPSKQEIRYRFEPGQGIYRSQDGGYNWQKDFDLSAIDSEVHRALYARTDNSGIYVPGPIDALIASRTGNVIAGMGLDGLLVRTDTTGWQWVSPAEKYQFRSIQTPASIMSLLQAESIQVFGLMVLMFLTITLMYQKYFLGLIVLTLAFFVWFLGHSLVYFFRFRDLADLAPIICLQLPIILTLILALPEIDILLRQVRFIILTFVISILAGTIYFLPYLLWSQNVIPRYGTAQSISLSLALIAVILSYYIVRRNRQEPFEVGT